MSEILLPVALAISTLITIVMVSLPTRYSDSSRISQANGQDVKRKEKTSVQVLVLGDIGRSPRMQYHAISIASHGGQVALIGYQESPLHPLLINNPLVTVQGLPPPPSLLRKSSLPFILVGPLKVLHQFTTLLFTLLYTLPPARTLLVQNPPSIPVLLIAYVVSVLRGTRLIIDWHNYGYTILSNKLPTTHPLVRISRLYEQTLAKLAPTANLTVTHAMAKQLEAKPWNVTSPIYTLHDRPANIFQPITSPSVRQKFLETLEETRLEAASIMKGTTKLLVSSTSWTPDEDFSLLLDALVSYASLPTYTPILAIITGKGPDKARYLDLIERLGIEGKLGNIEIKTAWLSMEDYAKLLACADLGVCLHMSSSGVDLPMKVVDMFGAGLPVVGYGGYESWGELVTEGVNGRGFETVDGLRDVFVDLLGTDGKKLSDLKEGAMVEGSRRWNDEWDAVAKSVFFEDEGR